MAAASWESQCLASLWGHFHLKDDVLYLQYMGRGPLRLIVPDSLGSALAEDYHQRLNHIGQHKLGQVLTERFWWPYTRKW